MAIEKPNNNPKQGFRPSLDTWAVLVALVLAAAVRFHILKGVPW
jgi:hypothetical protein